MCICTSFLNIFLLKCIQDNKKKKKSCFFPCTVLEFVFWEDLCLGDSLFYVSHPGLYHLSNLHHGSISHFANVDEGRLGWDFHLFRNLNDREAEELA